MGNAAVQGRLWGANPQDYAEYLEQVGLPLMGAALDAARVTRGTSLLDAGCGAGLGALLAALRGASVAAIAASGCPRPTSGRATLRRFLSPRPPSTR